MFSVQVAIPPNELGGWQTQVAICIEHKAAADFILLQAVPAPQLSVFFHSLSISPEALVVILPL